jgi:hypothetical protein
VEGWLYSLEVPRSQRYALLENVGLLVGPREGSLQRPFEAPEGEGGGVPVRSERKNLSKRQVFHEKMH